MKTTTILFISVFNTLPLCSLYSWISVIKFHFGPFPSNNHTQFQLESLLLVFLFFSKMWTCCAICLCFSSGYHMWIMISPALRFARLFHICEKRADTSLKWITVVSEINSHGTMTLKESWKKSFYTQKYFQTKKCFCVLSANQVSEGYEICLCPM